MVLSVESFTNQGTRKINEDYVTYKQDGEHLVAIVADGLGGHDKGEVASEHVGKYLVEHFEFGKNVKEELDKNLLAAQNTLLELQQKEHAIKAMKTTAVAIAVEGDKAWMAHVGDSRGYIFYRNGEYSRTRDHSVSQMLVLSGEIQEKDIRHHVDRSRVLRVMGSEWEKNQIEFEKEIKLEEVQAILLCSDGFWELVVEEQMREFLNASKTPKEWVEKMAKVVRKNGKGQEMDNYTALAVFVEKKKPWWKFW